MRRLMGRMAMTAVVGVVAVAGFTSPAAAAQKPTPNERCGAANMMNENAREQMLTAMAEHTNEHGDLGMARAVAVSGC